MHAFSIPEVNHNEIEVKLKRQAFVDNERIVPFFWSTTGNVSTKTLAAACACTHPRKNKPGPTRSPELPAWARPESAVKATLPGPGFRVGLSPCNALVGAATGCGTGTVSLPHDHGSSRNAAGAPRYRCQCGKRFAPRSPCQQAPVSACCAEGRSAAARASVVVFVYSWL